jgi:hypothetical protein
MAQGYYMSAPLQVNALTQWLRTSEWGMASGPPASRAG